MSKNIFPVLSVDSLEFYRSIKENNKDFDPPFRFSNEHIDLVKKFPVVWPEFKKTAGALLLTFEHKDSTEHHAFFINSKVIDHFEVGNSGVKETTSSWIIIDILKRMGVIRSIDSVTTTTFTLRDKLTVEQQGLLLEFILFFRLQKRSQANILKKLKSRKLDALLSQFQKDHAACWSLSKRRVASK